MNMQSLMKLKELLCEELDEISERGELSAGQLDTVQKLTGSIKNICKIMSAEEDEGYSRDGGFSRGGYSRSRYSRRNEQEPGRDRPAMMDEYSYRRY